MNGAPGPGLAVSGRPASFASGGMEGALARYRLMSWVVGAGLLVLVLVGVPLQVGANAPAVVQVVGPIHGFLYIAYLVTAFDLARRARVRLGHLVLMLAAGLVPFLAFSMEARTTKALRAELLARAPGSGAPLSSRG